MRNLLIELIIIVVQDFLAITSKRIVEILRKIGEILLDIIWFLLY